MKVKRIDGSLRYAAAAVGLALIVLAGVGAYLVSSLLSFYGQSYAHVLAISLPVMIAGAILTWSALRS